MAEIEMTAEMLRAGAEAMEGATIPMRTGWLPIIYRAMRALEPAAVPDPIRHTAMEYAVRCTPSRVDLIIPLARAIEVYLRGEGELMSPAASMQELTERVEKRREVERHGTPPPSAA